MFKILAPEEYVNEPGVILEGGPRIARYGKQAFVLADQAALKAAGRGFFISLEQASVNYTVYEHEGYCTIEAIKDLSDKALSENADLIIGIGGGRILDLAKELGEQLDLPVVAVPTIAATCAAWSALSIIYNEDGTYQKGHPLKKSPVLVLADTSILAQAPPRYLAAGIADTVVKWYEYVPNLNQSPDNIHKRVSTATAKLALDVLLDHAREAYRLNAKREVGRAVKEVTDAIIFLAGQVGSIRDGNPKVHIAHAIHNSLTSLHDTHGSLHGEKVAFGLIAQLLLEDQSEEHIRALIDLLRDLHVPITLAELGLKGDIAQYAAQIASGVKLNAEAVARLPFKVNSELLRQAIIQADALGRRVLSQAG